MISLFLQQTLEDNEQRRQFERLGQKLFGAFFNRTHGQIDRAVRRQHQQRSSRVDLFETRQQIERGAVRQHVVGDYYIRSRGAKNVLGVLTAFAPRDRI